MNHAKTDPVRTRAPALVARATVGAWFWVSASCLLGAASCDQQTAVGPDAGAPGDGARDATLTTNDAATDDVSRDANAVVTRDITDGDNIGISDAGNGTSNDAATAARDASLPTFDWHLPPGFPAPPAPADNPMTAEKVELGRHLFYDRRLSRDETMSCASCHRQDLAFTDGATVSKGITGQHTERNSMMLANVAYASSLTWANPLQLTLERQALVPLFGDTPVELGWQSENDIEQKLRQVQLYQDLFKAAFPNEEEPITLRNVVHAIASFERTLISGNSPFDRYLYQGRKTALTPEARKGYALFNSEKLECFHCHVGFNLSDHTTFKNKPFIDRIYHNTGLYNIDGEGAYPAPNTGLHSVTGKASDMGKFKAPSLRNIAVTAPYMHDGSIATLEEVLDHYMNGGRVITSGPHAGDGSKSPLKDPLIRGFELTEDERSAVLAFLNSLTDETFLTEPRFSDPWLQED